MDPLAHVFLPLLVAYAARPELFAARWPLALAGFGVLPDADKFLGLQGLGHSLVTVLPVALVVVAAEYAIRKRLDVDRRPVYALLASAFLLSHLALDVLDGGPVPLLFPVVTQGLGLVFPATVTFGQGLLGVVVEGPLVALHSTAPRVGHQTFGFFQGAGVASLLAFLVAYAAGERARGRLSLPTAGVESDPAVESDPEATDPAEGGR